MKFHETWHQFPKYSSISLKTHAFFSFLCFHFSSKIEKFLEENLKKNVISKEILSYLFIVIFLVNGASYESFRPCSTVIFAIVFIRFAMDAAS